MEANLTIVASKGIEEDIFHSKLEVHSLERDLCR